MTAVELKQKIVAPQLGPLEIEQADWRMLVRHVKAYCRDFEKARTNPESASAAFVLDILFVITRSSNGRHRLFLLPTYWRSDNFISEWVKGFEAPVAFGIVKSLSNLTRALDEAKKLNAPEDMKLKKVDELVYSLEPDTQDVKLSVELDKTVGKPLYYIIMNRKFEYDIYKSPIQNVLGLLQPADE